MAAWLPLWMLYPLSSAVAVLVHRVFGYRVPVVRRNLQNAFPEKTPAERYEIERQFYRNLCDIFVETVKLLHISDRQLRRRVELRNTELIGRLAEGNGSIILFMGHCGNWEWVPALTLGIGRPRHMGALYKPLHDSLMDRVMLRIRSRFDQECIPVKNAYRRLVEMKRCGEAFMIGFIADQRPVGQPLHHWTTFLNQPTPFMAGGETIGTRVGAHFVYTDIERVSRGHYVLTFKEMTVSADDKEEYPYTRLFFRMLEDNIRRSPAVWLWSHNRWKANYTGSPSAQPYCNKK